MGKSKNLRAFERYTTYHTKNVFLIAGEARWPVIDMSFGGVSISDTGWDSVFHEEQDFNNAFISFGECEFPVDVKAVSFDDSQHMIGIKFEKYRKNSKQVLKSVTLGLKIAQKPKKYKIVEKDIGLKIKTKKFQVGLNDQGIHILKKSLFTRKSDVPFLLLGLILGVPRKQYDVKSLLAQITSFINQNLIK